MIYIIIFFIAVVFIGALIWGILNSEQIFLKKCNKVTKGMSMNDVISIMGNNFTRSEDNEEIILEWRKVKNGIMYNKGNIKGRPTLLGSKAKITGNTTVESGYTISFKTTFKNNVVIKVSTTTNNN